MNPTPIPKCTICAYVHALADRLLREYADADTLPDKDSALRNAIDSARCVENTVLPLLRSANDVERFRFIQGQCNRLLDLARPWIEKHPANFPKRPDHTLQILDILEGIETKCRLMHAELDRLTSRKADRAAAQRRVA